MRLQLRFLGGFESRLIDGPAVVLPTRKSKALLAYLALPAGRRHSREKLTALLWGDTAEPQARQNFRQALASIRRALTPGGAGLLIADSDTLGLEAAAVDVDALQFERLAALTRPEALEGAAALYQGDLLEGLDVDETPFQDWLRAERERLRELALEGLVRLLARQFEADSPDAATQTALRVLAFDPLQESVHRVLMRLYLRQGRRAAALRQYQLCVTALQRELGADPEPETTELYRDLLRSEAPATAGPAVRGSSLAPRSSDTPLIGREAEMEYLRRALEMAWDGRARATLVVGEAGAGKTRLVEELLAEAERLGGRTLFGRGYEGERVLPLRVWVEAIRAGQLLPGEGFHDRLSAAERRELARLFPEIGEADPDGPARPDDLPRLFEALTRLLTEVASRQPIVIALDDLHVADEMTVRLLAFAARRTWGLPLLLVGTVREEDAQAELTRILDELEREGRLERLHVAALSLDDSVALATAVARQRGRARLPADVAAQVWAVSEGNPFVIVETMRSLHPDAHLDAADAIAIPLHVKDMIRGRLERLGQASCHPATVAAVIGRDFSFALLQRAAELSAVDAAAGVEELVRRRVLEAVGERFQFTHDRVRRVVDESIPPWRRAPLHAAIASGLEALHGDHLEDVYDELARHWTGAGDDARAFRYLLGMARKAAHRYAVDESIRLLHAALDHAERLPPEAADRARVDAVFPLAEALFFAGRIQESLARLLLCEVSVARLRDPGVSARYHFWLGHIRSFLDDAQAAAEHAHRALAEAVGGGDAVTMGQAHYVIARACYRIGDGERGVDHARKAIALLETTAEASWLGHAYWALATNLGHLGYYSDAMEPLLRARQIGEARGDLRLQAYAAWSISWSHLALREYAAAVAECERAVELAPDAFHRAFALTYLGAARVEQGAARAAIQALEEAQVALRAFEAVRYIRAYASLCLGTAYLAVNDLERAHVLAVEAVEETARAGWKLGSGRALRILGRVLQARGAAGEAEERLREAIATFDAVNARNNVAVTELLLAEVVHARGDDMEAGRLLANAVVWFRDVGHSADVAKAEGLAEQWGIALARDDDRERPLG